MNNEERKEYWRKKLYDKDYFDLINEESNIPESLFRFRPGRKDNLTKLFSDINTLYNNQVWVSEATQFNDPFDSMTEVDGELLKCNMKRTFCASFTEKLFDVCMWSHYANYHKGFCIEYCVKELQCEDKQIKPMVYSDSAKETRALGVTFDYIKAEVWEPEYEWRYREMNTAHYIGHDGFLASGFPKPKAIYIGCRMGKDEDEDGKELKKNIKKYCKEESVEFILMKADEVKKRLFI